LEEINIINSQVNNRLYNTLKWIGLIVCPLSAIVVKGFSPLWGITTANHTMLVFHILILSIGAILAFSEGAEAQQSREEVGDDHVIKDS